MNTRHLLLAALAHLALTAAAQDKKERTVIRNVDVREVNGTKTVTVTTTEDGVTNTQVLTGDEAATYLKKEGTHCSVTGEDAKAHCQVIVIDDSEGKKQDGGTKADVFRYRYRTKSDSGPDADIEKEISVVVTDADGTTATAWADGDDAEARAGDVSSGALQLYPNPNDGQFTVEFDPPDEGETVITVVDGAGREVFSERTSDTGHQVRSFDLSGEGKGNYIATLVQGGTTISKRLVIK